MIEFSVMMMAVTFIVTLLLSTRICYLWILRWNVKREAKRLGISLSEMSFSFEQMVYFIALPTTIPEIRDASKEQLYITPYYESYFFPEVDGIQVSVKTKDGTIPLAYLPVNDFSLPLLDRYVEAKQVDERTNQMMRAHLLIHPRTLRAIQDDVYFQLHQLQETARP